MIHDSPLVGVTRTEMSGILLVLIALQTATPQRTFDVVSVKPSKSDAVMQDMRITFPSPGRIEARNITLSEILLSMSGFSGRVEGGPKWAASERFDIVAKSEEEIPRNQVNSTFMAMLADRFQLVVHHEKKEETGFTLTIGKGAPHMTPAKDGEETAIRGGEIRNSVFQAVSMATLADYLGQILRTRVIDGTGLKGKFDFLIEPDPQTPGNRVTFADYLRGGIEQLGFRLEPKKILRDVTIIDQVAHPSWN